MKQPLDYSNTMNRKANKSAALKRRSLTLKLDEVDYLRLAVFAVERGLSHQDVIHEALLKHLGKHQR